MNVSSLSGESNQKLLINQIEKRRETTTKPYLNNNLTASFNNNKDNSSLSDKRLNTSASYNIGVVQIPSSKRKHKDQVRLTKLESEMELDLRQIQNVPLDKKKQLFTH